MMRRFEGKNVVVTGAANGLGRTIAVEMGKEGANLLLVDIAECDDTIKAIGESGGQVNSFKCNIAKEDEIEAMAEFAALQFNNRLDILINNAGLNGKANLVSEMKLEDWNRTLGVNLTGTMLVCRELVKLMLSSGGKVVNVASNVGKRGLPYRADYVCSKWALLGFTQTLALELANKNIRVNAVCPGPIEGDRIEQLVQMHADVEGISYEEMYKAWSNVPLGRFITPQEVSEVIMFLASDQSSSMTGQALNVTGGLIMS